MRRILLSLIGLVLLACCNVATAQNAPAPEAVSAAIAQMLTGQGRLSLPLERIRPALTAHYVQNHGGIYWVGTNRMTTFIQRLADAADDGLNPDDYPIDSLIDLRDSIDPNDPASAAQVELLFSAFLVSYATDLKIGRLTPQKVDPRLFRNRKSVDVLRILTELGKQPDPSKILAAFESHNPHYRNLKKMLALYRKAAESIRWPTIPAGTNIKPGGSDPRVPQIRELLTLMADYEGNETTSPVYDPETVAAMVHFQKRNGLESKGMIGKQTILALNIPPDERARQIMLNMERWRWMPENLGDYHFMVNLAAYELQEVKSSKIVDRMNVVVGTVATQTPEFSDELEYVELNPTWTVPYSIATKEMLPKLRANPGAYAAEFDVFASGKLSSWGAVNWTAYGSGNFPFTFRQRPGPKNALGRVKFIMPNKHDIYLHDTPAKDKFLSTSRAFSHGCIRLSRPIDFAYTVIGGQVGWPKQKIDAVLAAGKTMQVPLPKHIPVHLIYSTAFFGPGGIEFRPDVYGRDRKLYAALFGKPAS